MSVAQFFAMGGYAAYVWPALALTAVITDPAVVDRILAHRRRKQMRSPFESRAPPAPAGT